MGLFSGKPSDAAKWQGKAAEAAKKAKEQGAEAAKYRKGSTDPAADRAMIEHHEANQRIHEANARDFRNVAGGR